MITHSVFFKLKYPEGSVDADRFFSAARELFSIPGVQNFKVIRQTGKKNNYEYGLIMEFASQEIYDQYNSHHLHTQFVEKFWIPAVTDFIEIDYE
jgi:hypothetical protein